MSYWKSYPWTNYRLICYRNPKMGVNRNSYRNPTVGEVVAVNRNRYRNPMVGEEVAVNQNPKVEAVGVVNRNHLHLHRWNCHRRLHYLSHRHHRRHLEPKSKSS